MTLKDGNFKDSGLQAPPTVNSETGHKNGLPDIIHSEPKKNYGTMISENGTGPVVQVPKCNRVVGFLTTWSMELVAFLFFFGYKAHNSCIMNLMLDKACLNHLNFSERICNDLHVYEKHKIEVEKFANIYSQYTVLASLGIGSLVMLFTSPWSDRYGRKLLLVIGLAGMALDDIGAFINAIYLNAPLQYLIPPAVASGVTGGYIGIISIVSGLTGDATTKELRTMKFLMLHLSFGFGRYLGSLGGGIIYYFFSYQYVFAVAAIFHIIALFWAIVFIKENENRSSERWTKKLRDLFSIKNIAEGFKVLLKTRPNNGKLQLWLLLTSVCTLKLTFGSFYNIAYLYAFHMYNWGPTAFSVITSIFGCLGFVVIAIFVPIFVRTFKVGEPILGLVGTASMALRNLCLSFAIKTWIYFLGEACGILSTVSMTAVRSGLSKTVENNEQGKVFMLSSIFDSLLPLLTTIAMTHIYNASVTFFPGLCYLIATVVLVLPAISFWWMSKLKTIDLEASDQGLLKK